MSAPELWPAWHPSGGPMPDRWGQDMTLCIAAVSYLQTLQHEIVIAGDFLLSTEEWSTETWATKIESISDAHRWFAMFSGDPTVWHRMLGRLTTAVTGKEESLERV